MSQQQKTIGGDITQPVLLDPEKLKQFNIIQLSQFKKAFESEIEQFSNALETLLIAHSRLSGSSSVLEPLKHEKEGNEILIPLTSSLYVPGTLGKLDTVLVDVGVGYFIQKKIPEAQELLNRRAKYVKDNADKIQQRIAIQQENLRSITQVLQLKIQQQQQK